MKLKKTSKLLPWVIKQKPQPRQATDIAFYNSSAWRRLSLAIRIAQPVCLVCLGIKKHTPVTVVDHIIPVKFGGARLNEANLMAMCSECHNSKSAREQRLPLIPYVGTFGDYLPSIAQEDIVKIIINKI